MFRRREEQPAKKTRSGAIEFDICAKRYVLLFTDIRFNLLLVKMWRKSSDFCWWKLVQQFKTRANKHAIKIINLRL